MLDIVIPANAHARIDNPSISLATVLLSNANTANLDDFLFTFEAACCLLRWSTSPLSPM